MNQRVRTQCPYCGVGCGLIAEVDDGRLMSVSGDPDHPVNAGATCRKPLGLPAAVGAGDRARHPLWRDSQDRRFERVSWEAAFARLAQRIDGVVEEHGPDALAFYISGQLLTEDYYAAGKLVKGFLGTNNLDSNSRLCMSSAVSGYVGALGSDGPPAAYSDIDQTDCILLAGTNTAACHPIVWARISARQRAGAGLIVIDPRRTPTAEAADIHLPVRPGSDLPLLSAMLGVLVDEGLCDRDFIERHTEGFEAAVAQAREWPLHRAATVCGVPAQDIAAAARMFGTAGRAMALWSMGVNQSRVGTLKNRALINLCLATGNIGRAGTGPLSLTGQPNAMGGRETGGLSTLLPGYRQVSDPDHRAEMRRLWGLPGDGPGISPVVGLASTELVDALEDGRIKMLWIAGTNPVVSQPDARRFTAALRRVELLVCQDAYHPTETSALAHVALPAAAWPEKDGTMTNSERRIALVRRALDPPGEALPDWEIFARLGRALGSGQHFAWTTAAEVFDEFAACTAGRVCDISGVSHARLGKRTLQWPIPAADTHEGTERLYTSLEFPTPTGRARFTPTPHREPAERASPDFPLILTTGRIANQWHTMTRTAKSPDLLAAEPEPFIELHPADADQAGVSGGEMVRVRSPRGHAMLRARITDRVPPGTAFAPFHWGALRVRPGHGAVNALLGIALDPASKQAELKATAVCVEPVGAAAERSLAPGAGSDTRRLVAVGMGMAAMATVEALLEHDNADSWQITMIGREPELPYNRMMLSKHLAGAAAEFQLSLRRARWLAERGIVVRVGREVRAINTNRHTVSLEDGEEISYDRLVLATGSQASAPPLPGLDLAGVHRFRTLADARRIVAGARAADRAVVIGGGLLGLEAAHGLRAHGVDVTVLHRGGWLMERQLDRAAARLVHRSLERMGISVRLQGQTEAILGSDRVTGVRLSDGERLAADLVVIASGVRPDVRLAQDAGLEVDRAVVVDDEMRTSAPGIYAVGECAQHRDVVYGLWAPAREQAIVAAASLAGMPTAYTGSMPATSLKVAGIDLFCGGAPAPEPDDEEVVAMDTRRGLYRRLVLRDGRLVSATLIGDLRDAAAIRAQLASPEQAPDALLYPPAPGMAVSAQRLDDPHATVCTCMAVTQGTVCAAIREQNLDSVDAVARYTRAGSGCGSCRAEIAALLELHGTHDPGTAGSEIAVPAGAGAQT